MKGKAKAKAHALRDVFVFVFGRKGLVFMHGE